MQLRPGDAGDEPSEDWKKDYLDRAATWLGDSYQGPAKKRKSWHRLPSQHRMLAVDNALQHSTGKGVADFRDRRHAACDPSAPELQQRGHLQATLTVSCDQCSMNMCFLWSPIFMSAVASW